jgi:hypothetical protein
MLRFILNRWWALSLVLMLSIAGLVALPAVGRADGGGMHLGDGDPPGSLNPTQSAGDPDVPINTGQNMWKHGASTGSGRTATPAIGRTGVGDVTATPVQWSYTLRLAMKYFRLYVLRF